MCYQLFRKESVLFTPKNTLLERILATLLANYEEDSLDGDSFVSQSRFDAYAMSVTSLLFMKLMYASFPFSSLSMTFLATRGGRIIFDAMFSKGISNEKGFSLQFLRMLSLIFSALLCTRFLEE